MNDWDGTIINAMIVFWIVMIIFFATTWIRLLVGTIS